MRVKHLVSIRDLSVEGIREIFDLTARLKVEGRDSFSRLLSNKTLGLIFQKPSLRTRVSFEVAMAQLGGYAIYLSSDEVKLGQREAVKDIARTLSRYLDGVVARTFRHQDMLELAEHSTIPVINGLSDFSHPCQALTDLFTVKEKFGGLDGIKIAFIGDGNNVCNSLIFICAKLGVELAVATPKGYEPSKAVKEEASNLASLSGDMTSFYNDVAPAVEDADVLYTDVWTSMGQEKESGKRLKAFKGFQVNSKLCQRAKDGYYIMHCLPAHRGEEITDECMESGHSIVFDQAENRLHVEKAILSMLLK